MKLARAQHLRQVVAPSLFRVLWLTNNEGLCSHSEVACSRGGFLEGAGQGAKSFFVEERRASSLAFKCPSEERNLYRGV